MRPNIYVLIVSVLLGAFGFWFSADAVGQYLDTSRSFTSVHARYVPDSFKWLDPEHQEASAQFTFINDAPNDVTLAHLSLNLYFDGVFAGARYAPWERFEIPAGEEETNEVTFLTSIAHLREQGSDAELSLRGQMRLEFEGIERPLNVRISGPVGVVPYEED
jgi:hypothetical protein